ERLRLDAREVGTVREDRMHDLFRIPSASKLLDRLERVLLGVFFPIQVVEEPGERPDLLVPAEPPGIEADRRLDGLHVVPEPGALDPLLQECERVVTCRHVQPPIGSGRSLSRSTMQRNPNGSPYGLRNWCASPGAT